MKDPTGAFCKHVAVELAGDPGGALAGMRFVAKDTIDVAGEVCCAGNPDWLRTHAAAVATAPAIARLVSAGATLVGKTVLDELAYSIAGENLHYGAPANPRAPGHVAGGSSSGSASAVAAGTVALALGTDTGGSVRVPASYCGLYGLRTTHGAVSVAGVVPLAPMFDTVGWLARDAAIMRRVGEVMLEARPLAPGSLTLLLVEDALAVEPGISQAAAQAAARIGAALGATPRRVNLSAGEGLAAWSQIFGTIQARQAWDFFGPWIEQVKPAMAPAIEQRFRAGAVITDEQFEAARQRRQEIRRELGRLLETPTLLCFATTPTPAPPIGRVETEGPIRAAHRQLTCIAGLGGLPELSLPLLKIGGLPVGFSLLAASGADRWLLEIAESLGEPAAL